MNFLEKLDLLMNERHLNKSTLSQASGIPYTTIDGWYKRGYAGAKLPTIQKLADFFHTTLDYLIRDEITDRYYGVERDFETTHFEKEFLSKYRLISEHGKKIIETVLDIEYDEYEKQKELSAAPPPKKTDKSTRLPKTEPHRAARRYPADVIVLEDYSEAPEDTTTIPVYDAGASAGTGVFLDSDYYDVIAIPDNYTSRKANFAVWVDGHSMEPRFNDGDLVLVRTQPAVDIGEIGIFIVNGEGFIKKFGEGELISLNPAYENIPLDEWDEIYCKSRVLGKL